jgi:DNA polymerase elongation subunit (family B)
MSKKEPITFQIYDWMEDHEESDGSDSENDGDNQVYIIHTFGRTEDGKSVYMKITDYKPYFYIKLPSKWSERMAKTKVKQMLEYLTGSSNKMVSYNHKSHLINMKVVEMKDPVGFTNGKKFLFGKLIFDNYNGMKSFKYMFERRKIKINNKNYNFTIKDYEKNNKLYPQTIKINNIEYNVTHIIKLRGISEKFLPCVLKNGQIGLEMNKTLIDYSVYNDKLYIPGVTSKSRFFKTYESNFQPMLRCFHIRNVKGCGWVNITSYQKVAKLCKQTYCDIEISCHWKKIKPIEKNINAPLRILSYDIECFSHDGEFPQAHRKEDPIIQIGSVYTYLGESTPYRQHIVCLGETVPIENIIVKSYKTETEMIKGWIKEVIESDCDIITGYNIFYFDESYIHDRCEKILNLANEIKLISKFKYRHCNYRDFKLASSALGENHIRMYNTPGRIKVDLMKDIQKTFKLDSYKLDNVSSEFIRDEIIKIEPINDNYYNLYCKDIKDIFINDFIHIEQKFDFISDNIGKKYEIIKIIDNILTIKGSNSLKDFVNEEHTQKERYTLWWSQAKDDVGPKDIFRLYQGSSQDRSIVAKYCIKDCRLVNLLINKLQIISKNIAMSNVCFVPLSFLFTRGQLIKLISLVMKFYREEGFIFPVITKPIEKMPSFEGAIVFDPEPTVEYESLTVKDYASLYPSSILHKNMSHETIVLDEKYDNLPGVTYFNAKFIETDGSNQNRRFAKIGDELGVIPKMLQKLLKERKAVKKRMKIEKDPMIHMNLDNEQLALKVTCNSAYGGLGADISIICQRDIAACTTSTGREMLKFAKEYDENILPQIINGLKFALINNDNITYNKIIENELKNKNDIMLNKIKNYISKDIKKLTFQPVIRYGDSIPKYELITISINGNIIKDTVENILLKYYNYHNNDNDKEYYTSIFNIYSVTEQGLTKIKSIMKHYTKNNLYKIYTNSGNVTVTCDHSLILYNNNIIKPIDLKIGDKLLTTNGKGGIVKKIFNKGYYNDFVFDLTTKNHHFSAGNGNIVVHNTDSIFSCYHFHEDNTEIKYEDSLKLWKQIIIFSEKLLLKFIPSEYKGLINECYENNYDSKYIIDLKIPDGPKYEPEPTHYKTILNSETRINQLCKKYMDEFYLPWLWTLQKIFNKKINKNTLKDVLDVKLYRHGKELVQYFHFEPEELNNMEFKDFKNDTFNLINNFIEKILKKYIIQPYWVCENNKLVTKIKIYKKGKIIIDKRSLELSIDIGIISGELVKSRLPFPHDLEYEKTFWPFLILTKKRYVGNKYEFNKNKYKQDYNGIVLKRRDNAPIVKKICGGIINCLINENNPEMARKYTIDCLNKMLRGEYNIKYFITSKTLKMKKSYVDWTRIAHSVLADRIEQRDPGNAPQSGDRIEYAVVKVPVTKTTLQGERIETPQYIKENNLELDYEFYITNQIMKPSLQFLQLVIPNAKEEIFKPFLDDLKKKKTLELIKKDNNKVGRTPLLGTYVKIKTL